MTDIEGVDGLLLDRWHDAVGVREALGELEGRLEAQLDSVGQRVSPWLREQGFVLLEVRERYAEIEVGKASWMRKKNEALVWMSIAGLYPYGFRRVQDEHPYIWVYSSGLPKDEQEDFRIDLTNRLRNVPERWVNEDCGLDAPAGIYIDSHGDKERLALASDPEALESFIKSQLLRGFEIATHIDEALQSVRGQGKSK